jgi:hypothetical protein
MVGIYSCMILGRVEEFSLIILSFIVTREGNILSMTEKMPAHCEPAWHGLKKTTQPGREFFGGGSSMQT